MKLYATTTSERASKGQGGNEYLIINLQDERKVTFAELVITHSDNMALPVIQIMSNGKIQEAKSDIERWELEALIQVKKDKGNNQKVI